MSEEREPPGETPTIVAVLLATAAVIAAVIGIRAALLGDSGSDTWHGAIREDVKRGAGIVEDVRFLYEEEAPLAFQVAEGKIRAEETLREARGKQAAVRELLEGQAGSQAGIVDTVVESSKIASDPRYKAKGGSYDVLRRLADLRAKVPDLVALDPDATEARGSDESLESSLLVATTIPVGLGFLCGALANGFPARRRWLVPAGFALSGIGLVLAIVVELTH